MASMTWPEAAECQSSVGVILDETIRDPMWMTLEERLGIGRVISYSQW